MQTFSANGLAERLERDRATLIKALRNTPADRVVKGKPQWKIATASRAVEAHLRAYDGNGNGNGGGIDAGLAALYARFDQEDAALRLLPTLSERRAAACRMAGLLAEIDRAYRARGGAVGADPDHTALRADKMFLLACGGLEGPCEWSTDQVFDAMNAEPADA
jgi:hypothetical protein